MATLFKHAFKRALLVERSFLQVRCMQISAVMNSGQYLLIYLAHLQNRTAIHKEA